MAYSWDPGSGQFVWTTPTGGGIMGSLAPDIGAPQAWELAAQQAQPGYAARPGLARYMQGAYAPSYGQWLMSGMGGAEPGIPTSAFQDWLMGPQTTDPTGGTMYGANPRFGPASIAPPTTTPEGWANLVGIARAMSPVYGGDFGDAANLTEMPGYQNWIDILGDPKQAEALTAMATYDPAAGSMLGRMRGRGRARRMEEYGATRPGMTTADWLGYITGQPGMTGAAYQV
jgi:hypothetical protein